MEDYDKESGLKLKWEQGYEIRAKAEANEVMIYGNKEGLISLARHFLALAQDRVEKGEHIHLDECNSLEEGSMDLIVQKI